MDNFKDKRKLEKPTQEIPEFGNPKSQNVGNSNPKIKEQDESNLD